MTTEEKPGNLDARTIFEEAMKLVGWEDVSLRNQTPEGYSDARLQWAWIAWQVARNAALIQAALWYKEKGWMMDEDDIPQAIMDLSKPT